jgi:hypothetical protein
MEGIAAAKARGVYKGRPASIEAADVAALKAEGLGATDRPLGWMTMEGLRRIAVVALIIALVLLVILGFAAHSIFLFAKWLIGLVW